MAFRRHLERVAAGCALKPTTGPGAASGLARDAVGEGFDTVVAAGGDGTLNEVVTGIVSVSGGVDRVRLGLIPLGTVNVFARELGIPLSVGAAWEVVTRGKERRVGVAMARDAVGGTGVGRAFVQMASAGLDARAVELMDWRLKKRIGALAYAWAFIKAWREGPARVRVEVDERWTAEGEWVVVGNGRFYAGSITVFPGARMDDGLLHVAVVDRMTVWRGLAMLARAGTGRIGSWPGWRRASGRRVRVTGSERVSFQVEGEAGGELPVTFESGDCWLRVLAPGAA